MTETTQENKVRETNQETTMLKMTINDLEFTLRLERELAPQTVAVIESMLPLQDKIIHARWSGGAAWIPFGDEYGQLDIDFENATVHPSAGEILLYKGGPSQVEILVPYGNARFSSKAGDLPGNHFATVVSGNENLEELGRKVLWEGAQDITIERI